MGRKEERAVLAEQAARTARFEAQRAHNDARWNRRMHGIPDPDHDFTGAARIDYEMLCLQGIHPVGPDRRTCDVCGDWVAGEASEVPTTDVKGTSTRSRGHNAR